MDGTLIVLLVSIRRIRDGDAYSLETLAGAGRGDDESYAGAGLDTTVLVRGFNLRHVEVESLRGSVGGRVERDDEAVAAGRFGVRRVQVALAMDWLVRILRVEEGRYKEGREGGRKGGAYLDCAI